MSSPSPDHRPDHRPDSAPAGSQPPMSPEEMEAAAAANAHDAETQLAQLAQELEALKAQNTEISDQFLRAKAEVENIRRRSDDEVSKARKFAIDSFAESLLPVADSLEAGLAIQEASVQQIREGAEATLKQLHSALARHKVLPIAPAAGEKFDPHQHQAISVVPAEQEPNTVVSVLQKGYSMAERVLRPALVTVTAPK